MQHAPGLDGHGRPGAPDMPGRRPPTGPLDAEHQPLLVVVLHIDDVHVGNIEDGIGPGAPARTPNHP
jgi:hypothetical protein